MAIMERYADLRLWMRKPYGQELIGDVDTLIAATALQRGLTVVTTDRDFRQAPDLAVMLLDRDALQVLAPRLMVNHPSNYQRNGSAPQVYRQSIGS